MDEIFDTAFQIKERIYGNRIVLFAPLYIASECAGGGGKEAYVRSHA